MSHLILKRRLTTTVATAAVAATLVCLVGSPASASQLNTSYSAAVAVQPGTASSPTVTTGGVLGGLLGVTVPVLNAVVAPLSAALTALPGQLVTALGALTGSGTTANSSGLATSPPASGYPSCTDTGWDQGNCYGPLVPTMTAPNLISLGTGTLQGYAAADDSGSYSSSRVAGASLSVLGVAIGTIGASQSTATCTQAGACSTTTSLTNVSLLGGAVRLQSDSNGTVQVSVNNQPFISASALASTSVTAPGVLSAGVSASGNGVQLKLGLSLDTLLSALGITLNLNGGSIASSSVTLSVRVGAGGSTTDTTGASHGLELSLGLGVSVGINLGLATVGLSFPDPIGTNLAGAQFAFSSAADNGSTSPHWTPEAVM